MQFHVYGDLVRHRQYNFNYKLHNVYLVCLCKQRDWGFLTNIYIGKTMKTMNMMKMSALLAQNKKIQHEKLMPGQIWYYKSLIQYSCTNNLDGNANLTIWTEHRREQPVTIQQAQVNEIENRFVIITI